MSATVADATERARALDPEASFIVQAPAGSGKTELLIQRALTLLARVAAPEEVVAVTFTRKAAAEMRHRIVEALRAGQGSEPAAEHERRTWTLARAVLTADAEHGWGLLQSPGRLRILTFDALAAALTRQSPVLSGLAPGQRTADYPDALYREAALATLVHAENGSDHGAAVAATLAHFDGNAERVIGQIVAMLKCRDQWLELVAGGGERLPREQIEDCFALIRARALGAARRAVGDARLAEMLPLLRYAHAQLRAARSGAALPELPADSVEALAGDVDAWLFLAELLLTQKNEWRSARGLTVKQGFPPAKGVPPEAADRKRAMQELLAGFAGDEDAREALAAMRTLPRPNFDEAQWTVLRDLLDTLRLAAAELLIVFSRRAEVDFIEIASRAREALGSPEAPTELALKLDYRVQHLLLDEFQDTSRGQFELVERLIAGWQAGDGRTVFAVGDPMQSIYRFRQADVRLFLQAWADGIGGVPLEPLQLRSNFRSRPAIVDWVNRAFDGAGDGAFPARSDAVAGATAYAASVAARDDADGTGVNWHTVVEDRDAEAARIVELAQDELARDPDSRIAILVRARSHLAQVLPALRAAAVPFQAVDLDRLIDRPEVSDLRALAGAIAHPLDRLGWFSVLRAPWAGLQLADLLAIAEAVPESRPVADWLRRGQDETLSTAGRSILARIRPVLLAAVDHRGRQPFAPLVRTCWLGLGGADLVASGSVVADAFFEQLDRCCPAGDLADFRALDQALAERTVADAAPPGCRVQVLTMHKAKGLQFDVVILPGLDRGARNTENPPVIWSSVADEDGSIRTVLAPVHATGADTDPSYRHLRDEEKRRGELELARLLYVAATRARERLHLVAAVRRDEDGGAKDPKSGSLLQLLWSVFDGELPDGVEDAVEDEVRIPELQRLPPTTPAPEWPAAGDAAAAETDADSERLAGDAVPARFGWNGEAVRQLGLLFHRVAEGCANRGADELPDPESLRDRLRAELAWTGLTEPLLGQQLALLMRGLTELLGSECGRWVLAPHDDGSAELSLATEAGEKLVDRSFVDEAGTRWIVDYKTTAWPEGLEGDADRDAFIDAQVDRHREQLAGYAALFAAMEQRPICCALYFPMMGAWREWPA